MTQGISTIISEKREESTSDGSDISDISGIIDPLSMFRDEIVLPLDSGIICLEGEPLLI